ncbi:MAG TPA: CoA-binding protein [Deltaproteobacteria bacterium]|nr:CoA-binding protein [Deltaproteobacteria bacterium]HQI82357.1 CoA-binding protein [Deltaproteobacteria bacterium]
MDRLRGFFHPRGIAVFGSMTEGWFFGGAVVIKELQALGYEGAICPIHPTARTVYGLQVYPDISQVGAEVDLAVIATSCRAVPGILRACGEKGVKAAVVIADNFAEAGPEGEARQEELVAIAREYGIGVIGPNTLGIYKPHSALSTIPYEKGYHLPAARGGLSVITQTGMYGPQATPLNEYRFGVNCIIDLGNMCDIDEVDCLEHLENDPETTVIGIYMEHTRRPRAFLETARRVSAEKPVLCLKGGRSAAAARAMASHTGSIAGSDGLYDALFRQAGIVRVNDYEDLLGVAKAFLAQPLPRGNRLGIVSLTGAIGIQCIDIASQCGLVPGEIGASSRQELLELSPTLTGHPIDLGPASAVSGGDLFGYYERCFDILMADDGIDCIYLNTYISSYISTEVYGPVFEHMGQNLRKPVTMWAYGPSSEAVARLGDLAERHGIPFYPTTRRAVFALGYLAGYARWRDRVLTGSPC